MITVLGSSGFIGSYLVKKLESLCLDYQCPDRNDDLSNRDLGTVIYCIGVTADFRSRPLDTVDAHVCRLLHLIKNSRFESLIYLSSTRVYKTGSGLAREEDQIVVNPSSFDDIYNISKIMGESLVLSCGKNGKVARLSNVYGDDFKSENFLTSIISDAVDRGRTVLRTTPESRKDYISVDNVTDLLIKIALSGRSQIYNVASGEGISNRELTERLKSLTGCQIDFDTKAETIVFPELDVQRTREEFDSRPSDIISDLPELINQYRRYSERSITAS